MKAIARRSITIFVLVLFMAGMSSCAIHSYFPFICFEPGCVKQQWRLSGIKKQAKAKLAKQKRLRNARKIMDARYDVKAEPAAGRATETPALTYGRAHFYTKVKFVFYLSPDTLSANSDSLMVYMRDGRNFTEDDKYRTNSLVKNLRAVKISKVTISMYDKNGEVYRNTRKKRMKKAVTCLEEAGIVAAKIMVTE